MRLSACLDLFEERLAPVETKSYAAQIIANVKCARRDEVVCTFHGTSETQRSGTYYGRRHKAQRVNSTEFSASAGVDVMTC